MMMVGALLKNMRIYLSADNLKFWHVKDHLVSID
jgi:hypothetical protein